MLRATKRCVVGAFVVILSVISASAADIVRPAYKAPYLSPTPIFSWTGLYVGAHAGYGWSKMSAADTVGSVDDINLKGFLGGGQIGYNYQIGRFVLGAEADYSFANVKYDTPLFAGNLTVKNDYFITAAARLGYAFDRYLAYGKVGGAWTRDKWDGTDGTGGTVTGSFTRSGWMLGAGLEYAFLDNWSAKIEYDYLMFGSISPTLTTTGTLSVTGTPSIKLTTHIVKLGLNYRFNIF